MENEIIRIITMLLAIGFHLTSVITKYERRRLLLRDGAIILLWLTIILKS